MAQDTERLREVLRMIAEDAEADVHRFEGQPFTGKTVAEYMGCQAAAIKALAEVVEQLLPAIILDEYERTEIKFLLWSNKHQMWWRPDSRGYTVNRDEAGRYTQAEALEKVLASSYCMLLSQVTCMVAEAPDA